MMRYEYFSEFQNAQSKSFADTAAAVDIGTSVNDKTSTTTAKTLYEKAKTNLQLFLNGN